MIELDDASGLPSNVIEKIRRMISFLQDMAHQGNVAQYSILESTLANWWSKKHLQPDRYQKLAHDIPH